MRKLWGQVEPTPVWGRNRGKVGDVGKLGTPFACLYSNPAAEIQKFHHWWHNCLGYLDANHTLAEQRCFMLIVKEIDKLHNFHYSFVS